MGDRIAEPDFRPEVAVGLSLLAAAMKAKAGRIQLGDTATLIASCAALLPDDDELASAIGAFSWQVAVDQKAAGDRLSDFLDTWRRGVVSDERRQTEAAFLEISQEHFDAAVASWGARKDCGHD